MSAPDLETIKAAIHAWATPNPLIRRVHVFGSRIRGRTKDGLPVRGDSDLDIAVELSIRHGDDAFGTVKFKSMRDQWVEKLAKELPWKVEVHWYDPQLDENLAGYLRDCSEIVFERKVGSAR